METSSVAKKPHAVCIPFPFQGHIIAMLKLAKVLHFKGFHITLVYSESIYQQILASTGPDALKGLPDFRFETVPDAQLPSDTNGLDNIDFITKQGLGHIRNLIAKLNQASTLSAHDPPVSCIVSDLTVSYTQQAADELGIPHVLLWPMSASVLICFFHSHHFVEKGLVPLKDKSYLDMHVDFIPGLKNFRLKDITSFFWDGNDHLLTIFNREIQKASKASAILLNTFDALESEVLNAIKSVLPTIYTIGPMHFFEQQIPNQQLHSFGYNLVKEDQSCLKWLDSQQPNSVVYVNFGSTTVMTEKQLLEFAWGLANSKHPFLWVIRPDLVIGEVSVLPPKFLEDTADRSMISGWCPQEKVLGHSSTAGFLTHCGWNSIMDTLCSGVPIISWPFFGDQPTNCQNARVNWGIGMEIDKNVKRDDVEGLVRELMEGEKGKEMKKKSMQWKKIAQESTILGGSSYVNLDKIVKEVLLREKLH